MNSYRNNPRYSSIDIEEAGIFKGGKSKPVSVRSGARSISKFGFTFSFRTKPQYREILNFIKVYKSEGSVIDTILNEFTPRQAGIQLRVQYNFSNTILKSII
jgi:hypothetical protein